MRLTLLISILCTSFIFNSVSQRIKYKNLFPVLQSKDYKAAEPQLLKFLEDNDDEANAYFYLGEIIVSKLDSVEFFPSTEKYDSMTNLAIDSYKKAISLVDEREVRKNDEYYIAYNRRDLRTGKFGIKVSDVHLDYENKIDDVVANKELIHELHQMKEEAISIYEEFKNELIDFYSSYPDESSYLLRANSEDRNRLEQVKSSFNDFKQKYSNFSEKLTSLNHQSYNPKLTLFPIDSWNQLDPKSIDFSDFKVEIQNYDSYLTKLNSKIETEVQPIKELLYKTNSAFNEALDVNASVNDSSEVIEMTIPEELKDGLAKLDKEDLVYNLLQYKQLKNRSVLLTNTNLFPVLLDSSNIYQRTNIVKKYKNRLANQLDMIRLIDDQINERTKTDFATFFATFSPSIDAYITTEKTILEKNYETVSDKSKEMDTDIQYFISEEDTVYITPLNAAANDSENYVLDLIESDSSLLIVGTWQKKPFVANAGFDMKIRDKLIIEDTSLIVKKMINLNDNILVDLKSTEEDNQSQMLLYLSYKMEEIWRLEFESEAILGDAKVEAGIFFLYDEDGKVLKTLNAKGEVIGN